MSKKPTKFLDVNGRVIDDTSARYLTTVCTSVSREQFDEPEIRVANASMPNAPAGYQWPHLKTPARELV